MKRNNAIVRLKNNDSVDMALRKLKYKLDKNDFNWDVKSHQHHINDRNRAKMRKKFNNMKYKVFSADSFSDPKSINMM